MSEYLQSSQCCGPVYFLFLLLVKVDHKNELLGLGQGLPVGTLLGLQVKYWRPPYLPLVPTSGCVALCNHLLIIFLCFQLACILQLLWHWDSACGALHPLRGSALGLGSERNL